MTQLLNTVNQLEDDYWTLITSDPDIFNDMLKEYGVKDTKVEELYTTDFANLEDEGPVHGIIFISEYQEEPLPKEWENEDPDEDKIVFTSQVVANACGTLALMNVVLNSEIKEKGNIINNFNDFTKGFSSVNRGLCLGNSKEIRSIHNSYLPATHQADKLNTYKVLTETCEPEDGVFTGEDEKVYHYIAYIYKNGFIWELDGLKARPYKICECKQEEWLKQTETLIQDRMATLESLEFSMMAIRHANQDNMATDNTTLNPDIIRLKFDYFPFIEALITKAYKRGLVEEPEVEKSEVEEKVTKKRKKSTTEKSTTKKSTTKKSPKKRAARNKK